MVTRESLSGMRRHLKGSPAAGLVAATLGFFVGFAGVALYGPAAREFKGIMSLSGLALGLLVAAPQLTGSLLRIPFGSWVDRAGGKRPFLILLGLSIAGMAGLTVFFAFFYRGGAARGLYPVVLALGFLSGCGVATFSVGIPQTAYWFPKSSQGRALGAYAGLGNTAPGIFTLLLPLALAGLGLAGAYAAWLAFLVVGTAVYWLIAHDAYYFQLARGGASRAEAAKEAVGLGEEIIPSGAGGGGLSRAAGIGRTWGLVLMYFTSFGGFLALTSWFPTYWSLDRGESPLISGVLTAVLFSLAGSLVRVGGGALSDRFGGERTAAASYGVVILGAGILALSPGFGGAIAAELLLAVGMGCANGAVFKLVPRYVPEAVGGASGLVGGLGAFGGFVVPPVLGLFVDRFGTGGYSSGFLVYVALALASLAAACLLMIRAGRSENRPSSA